MASLLSLHPSFLLTHRSRALSSPSPNFSFASRRRGIISCFSKALQSNDKKEFICSGDDSGSKRREVLIQSLFAVSFPFLAIYSKAETDVQESFRSYEDETNKFRISVPQDWLVGSADSNSFKSVTAFYPQEASDSNVSVVITGVGPDFTRLESFGTVDAFAENVVTGMDRSWKRPPGLAAKLINSKAANGLYYIEYTLQNPGERCRHIISAIGMASNGWYNRLYTVSGQFIEDESEKYRSEIEKSVSSFRLF